MVRLHTCTLQTGSEYIHVSQLYEFSGQNSDGTAPSLQVSSLQGLFISTHRLLWKEAFLPPGRLFRQPLRRRRGSFSSQCRVNPTPRRRRRAHQVSVIVPRTGVYGDRDGELSDTPCCSLNRHSSGQRPQSVPNSRIRVHNAGPVAKSVAATSIYHG